MEIWRYLVGEMRIIPGPVSVVPLQILLSNFRYTKPVKNPPRCKAPFSVSNLCSLLKKKMQ